MTKWIKVEDQLPECGQIVVAWMFNQKEPVCVRFDRDRYGPIWRELVMVPIETPREDLISHWIPLPIPPEEN